MAYAGSLAQAGRGSVISIGATPTPIGEVNDFPMERGKWETTDVTNFESGSDSEVLPTIRKPGTLTFKGNRVGTDAGQILVETAYQTGALEAFSVALPKTGVQVTKGDTYTFSAFVIGSSFTIMPTKEVQFSVDLQISGPTTFTAGA